MAAVINFTRSGGASLESLRFASSLSTKQAPARSCDWPELERLLPDGGLPHAVVEITCAHGAFAGATGVCVAAVRAALARDARAWCAWIDADCTLFAPGLAHAGVDLSRLLVIRPPRALAARVSVKVAASGAFDVLVIESPHASRQDKLVRKLALAAEQYGTTIVLLAPPHVDPWPVALRFEVARAIDGLEVRVTKDRFGRGLAKARIPLSLRHAG